MDRRGDNIYRDTKSYFLENNTRIVKIIAEKVLRKSESSKHFEKGD
jgi:hypothetical protein